MKITNKKNVRNLRFLTLTLSFVLITTSFLVAPFYLNFFLVSIFIGLSVYSLTVNFHVYEYSGECVSFIKYSLFKNGYVRPYVEIPVSYIRDFKIRKFLHTYYFIILIDNGAEPRKIILPLHWFKELQIMGIIKSLENIKKNNTVHIKDEIEKLLHATS